MKWSLLNKLTSVTPTFSLALVAFRVGAWLDELGAAESTCTPPDDATVGPYIYLIKKPYMYETVLSKLGQMCQYLMIGKELVITSNSGYRNLNIISLR